jgi:SAM-dependent methyltransferase
MRRIWPWPALLLEEAAEWLKVLSGGLWLDAACGEGQLARLLGGRKRLVGLDIDRSRLGHARSATYVALVQGSVDSLPVADASVSGIASIETLEHVPDIDAALCEFSRCLRRGGYLLLTLPSVTLRSRWQMLRTKQPVYCDGDQHVREFSSVTIRGFPHVFETWHTLELRFRRHHFEVIRTGGVGFVLPMWEGRLGWVERGMNLLYREKANRWIGKLPIVRRFPYYRMYLLQREGAT